MRFNNTAFIAIIAVSGLLAFYPTAAAEPTNSAPTYEEVKGWITAYKAAHPGRDGKDWDINKKKPSEIAADPAAQQLL